MAGRKNEMLQNIYEYCSRKVAPCMKYERVSFINGAVHEDESCRRYCTSQEKVIVIKSYFSLALATTFASINCILITQLKLNSIS